MLTEKLLYEVIENFIDISIQFKDRIAIVTDLKPEYDKIMSELKFVHQHCTFHLEKNIKSNMEKKIKKYMVNYRFELKNTHPEYSEEYLDEIIKEEKEELKLEMWEYIADFMELFKQLTFNEAIDYINILGVSLNPFFLNFSCFFYF